MQTNHFLHFLFALIATWLLLSIFLPKLRIFFPDKPNIRSSHALLTPRAGGVVFVVVSCLGSFTLLFRIGWSGLIALPFFIFPLALVGLLDDYFNLPNLWRYAVQLLTALVLIFIAPLFSHQISTVFHSPISFFSIFFLIITITAVINFTNFMDGLDGLVAGCMMLIFAVSAISLNGPKSDFLWMLVGVLFGFLIWNWSPAKVFMGDVGSTFLGAIFAGVLLQSPSLTSAFGLLLVGTPILADALICVPRRLLSGQRVFEPHRLHLFQRLNQAGWPHSYVAGLYIFATLILGIAFLGLGALGSLFCSIIVIVAGIILDQNIAVPFVKSISDKSSRAF